MSTEPNWSEFEGGARKPQTDVHDAEFDIVCGRLFNGNDGKAVLAALRARFFDMPINPASDERALRVRITQQQFVRSLELARDRGLKAAEARKAK